MCVCVWEREVKFFLKILSWILGMHKNLRESDKNLEKRRGWWLRQTFGLGMYNFSKAPRWLVAFCIHVTCGYDSRGRFESFSALYSRFFACFFISFFFLFSTADEERMRWRIRRSNFYLLHFFFVFVFVGTHWLGINIGEVAGLGQVGRRLDSCTEIIRFMFWRY